jgi:hypothetical protein
MGLELTVAGKIKKKTIRITLKRWEGIGEKGGCVTLKLNVKISSRVSR